jgi:hypothetical protein
LVTQTKDPAEWQPTLRELDSKVAGEKVADFWVGLRAYIAQQLDILILAAGRSI